MVLTNFEKWDHFIWVSAWIKIMPNSQNITLFAVLLAKEKAGFLLQ